MRIMKTVLLLLVACQFAVADEIRTLSISASGVSSAPADFISVTVNVTSECYKDGTEALKDNSEVSTPLFETMKSLKKNEKEDRVTADLDLGFVRPSRHSQCSGFRATRTLTLELHGEVRGEEVAEAITELVKSGGKAFTQPTTEQNEARTYASLSTQEDLQESTSAKVLEKAMEQANDSLREKLKKQLELCGLTEDDVEFQSRSVSEQSNPLRAYRAESAGLQSGVVSGPISPRTVTRTATITQAWRVTSSGLGICKLPAPKKQQK